jgi:RNA polymerase sigma-70 factor (ECF subfamily)
LRRILPTARSASLNRALVPLLHAIAEGDELAFAKFYRLTSARMLRTCNLVLHDEGNAHDALQDVYFVVWQKASGFDEAISSPTTWLHSIARNKAIDQLRRQHVTSDLTEVCGVADGCSSALDVLISEQDKQRLHECIRQLEPHRTKLIHAAFFADITYSDLARMEAVPLGTMKSWLRRSLTRLRISMVELN